MLRKKVLILQISVNKAINGNIGEKDDMMVNTNVNPKNDNSMMGKTNIFAYFFKLTLLHIFIFFTMTSCGAKKKSLDIVKTKTKEKKDLAIFQQNDILSSILLNKLDTQITFEPINTAIPIKINDSTTIHNARVVISVKKTDSTVINRDSSSVRMVDKGEVQTSKKEKKMEKEVEGNGSDIKWSIWGIAVIIIGLIVGYLLYLYQKRNSSNKIF